MQEDEVWILRYVVYMNVSMRTNVKGCDMDYAYDMSYKNF